MIRLILLLSILSLVACSKPLTTEEKHSKWIGETLGGYGHLSITNIQPPAGPWKLRPHNGSYYYLAKADGHTFYVEAYISSASILTGALGGDIVYRYRYYEEVRLPLVGTTYRKMSQ